MLYGTAPCYGTGARADARIRTSVRIRVSILKPVTAFFLKLKCKNMHGSTQRWRGSVFLLKNIMFKLFLKLLGVTRTRIRILGSGSIKNSSKQKMQMIPDPDVVLIRESYQTRCECIRIRILESGFGNFYAEPRFASDLYRTVRIPSSGFDWAIFSCVCKGTRHLDHP